MMNAFPERIELPEAVNQARYTRKRLLSNSLTIGIAIRLLIVTAELLGVLVFDSVSLLLDAMATGIDIVASIALLVCIRLAARPPDENHPFGHGRYEPLAGLQMGGFLAFVGGGVLAQQVFHLLTVPQVNTIYPLVWLIPLGSCVLLEGCYRLMSARAKKTASPALAADAVHYRIDAIQSLLATIALFLGMWLPDWSAWLDHLGAITIACLMVGVGLFAMRDNMHQLVDHIPEKEYFKRVREATLRVAGVLETEKLRIQLFGPDAHVSIDVEVEPELSVAKAHLISQEVRTSIQKEWPAVQDVIVHLEPYYPNDHEIH